MAKSLSFWKKETLRLLDVINDFDLMIGNTLVMAMNMKDQLEAALKEGDSTNAAEIAKELERLKNDSAHIEVAITRTDILKDKIFTHVNTNRPDVISDREESNWKSDDSGTTEEPRPEVPKEA